MLACHAECTSTGCDSYGQVQMDDCRRAAQVAQIGVDPLKRAGEHGDTVQVSGEVVAKGEGGRARAIIGSRLREDVADMDMDRPLAQRKVFRDLAVGVS